jgi:23S rRNA (cytosine1962-C5)-methyltransferase
LRVLVYSGGIMRKELDIKIKNKYNNLYKEKQYPLILKNAVDNLWLLEEEGSIINIFDFEDEFIGRGYYGIQNKGIGWMLTYKESEKIDGKFFQKKLITALNKRKNFYYKDDTNCFRIFNSVGDGIGGLTIDYYDDYYLFNWYSEGIYSFKDEIYDKFKNLVYFKGIYQKKRFDDKGKYIEDDDFVMGERGDFPMIVKENNVKVAVDLNDGPMVGFFLDQRKSRKTLMEKYSKGRDVLNTFSYTGIFSVFAALGGSKSTVSVDLANRSLEKTKEQFEINGIDLENNTIVVEDIFEYFTFAQKKDLTYDMIILDPPSFAKSKNYIFKADKNYKDIISQSIRILKEDGLILASTNLEKMDMDKFVSQIEEGVREENKKFKILEIFTQPEDFKVNESYPEGKYLKVVLLKIFS